MLTLGSLFDGIGGWLDAGIRAGLYPQETAGTLNCMHDQQAIITNKTVRRLTPIECERLQGWPDNYTNVPLNGKPASDSARYKALGNGMAQPCARWLMQRVVDVLEQE